jgi:hypothetical protein
MIRPALVGALALLLSGCGGTVNTVALTPENTVRANRTHDPKATQLVPLRCAYRLADVRDDRPDGDSAGGLGWNQLVMSDATSLVAGQLHAAGLAPPTTPEGTPVVVTLKRLYVAQEQMTKVSVVVYEVAVDGNAPYLVRAQSSRGNWNSSTNEALSVFGRGIAAANAQLVTSLNERCPG